MSVKGLIKYRETYDIFYKRNDQAGYALESFQDLSQLLDEIICLYVELDDCINRCGLTERQNTILEKYMDGHTEEKIAADMNVSPSTINGIINSCCKKISSLSNDKWKDEFILWSKKKVTTNYKKCSQCGEFLPTTEEYFGKHPDTSDKLQSVCKKCDKLRKKT